MYLQVKTACTANCELHKSRLTSHSSLWQVLTEHETKYMPAVLGSGLLLFELYLFYKSIHTFFKYTYTKQTDCSEAEILLLGRTGTGKKEKSAEYKNSTSTSTMIHVYCSVLVKKKKNEELYLSCKFSEL